MRDPVMMTGQEGQEGGEHWKNKDDEGQWLIILWFFELNTIKETETAYPATAHDAGLENLVRSSYLRIW